MSVTLVFVEHQDGKIKRSSQELLQFATQKGQKTVALVFGSKAAEAVSGCAQGGAQEVHLIKDAKLDNYNSELYTAAVTEVLGKLKPSTVLASASSLGRDLFPRVAARAGAGLISDAIELQFEGNKVKAKKPLYAGKCFVQGEAVNSPFQVILMRANQIPLGPASPGAGAVVEHALPAVDLKTLVQEVVKGASTKLDLTEANIIVSGGRGLKEAGNFKMLHDLADVLGATVGASRAVVDAGWVSHDMQVGQTGKTVAPTLYIAVGVSGAIQHLAGMSGSKVIVAINSDPNAPIFQKATYGLVGDAFEIVPKLTEEFRKVLYK
ncbi:MAG: electron transfer flavoprotein subunit alpha/FixB family protein [Bdellovibrionales bacterium]